MSPAGLWFYSRQYMRIGMTTNIIGHYWFGRTRVFFKIDGVWSFIWRPYT
jgi:hypothetical protein